MNYRTLMRLRVLALLLALFSGVAGQSLAAMAMPMPMQMPQDTVASGKSTMDSGRCPACPKQSDVPGSPAMGCATIFCPVLPAVLPAAPLVAPPARASFPLVVLGGESGLTLRPDLGPPRPIHHS